VPAVFLPDQPPPLENKYAKDVRAIINQKNKALLQKLQKIDALIMNLRGDIVQARQTKDLEYANALLTEYFIVVDAFENFIIIQMNELQASKQFNLFVDLVRFVKEQFASHKDDMPDASINMRENAVLKNFLAKVENTAYGDDLVLIDVKNYVEYFVKDGDLASVAEHKEELAQVYSSSRNRENILNSLNYVSLVLLYYFVAEPSRTLKKPLKISHALNLCDIYAALLAHTAHNAALGDHLELTQFWRRIVDLVYKQLEVEVKAKDKGLNTKDLKHCKNAPSRPQLLKNLLVKYALDCVIDNFQVMRRTSRTGAQTGEKTSLMLTHMDTEILHLNLNFIHEYNKQYPEDKQKGLFTMARAMQQEYIPTLSTAQLQDYHRNIVGLASQLNGVQNSLLVQQYYIDTQSQIEARIAEKDRYGKKPSARV